MQTLVREPEWLHNCNGIVNVQLDLDFKIHFFTTEKRKMGELNYFRIPTAAPVCQTNFFYIPCYHQHTLPSTPFVATSTKREYLCNTISQIFLHLHKKIDIFRFRLLRFTSRLTQISYLPTYHLHYHFYVLQQCMCVLARAQMSVCQSIKHVNCDKTKEETSAKILTS